MEHTSEDYEHLWLLTNALPQGAALIDSQGKLLFANQSFARLAELKPEEIIRISFSQQVLDKLFYD